MKKIVIIDYGLGNIFSIQQAFLNLGQETIVSKNIEVIKSSDALILPGVGAYSEAMLNLKKLNLIEVIQDFYKTGKPILGVCLGMQLLFSKSYEFGIHEGLDIVKGEVLRFDNESIQGEKILIPHVGWNDVISKKENFKEFNNCDMYFVHSYFVIPEDKNVVLFESNYAGVDFCSAIIFNNVIATQFHPEKSGEMGLKLFKKWIELI